MTITDVEIENFLEHFGVKGQQWGVRRAQAHRQGRVEKSVNRQLRNAGEAHRNSPLSGAQKLGVVGGGLVGGFIASRLTMGAPIGTIAGATIGVVATHALLKDHANKKLSDIRTD